MTVNQTGTVNQARERILGMISEQSPTEPTAEAKPEEDEVEAQAEPEVEDPETLETDGDTEDLYTVKVNGEEKQVTLEELQKGYMMESDYRQKTSQVSEKRKAIEAQQAQLEKTLDEARAFIEFEAADLESTEMQELKEYDPEAYWKKVDAVKAKAERFKEKQDEQRARLEEKRQALIEKEREKLTQAIPDWLDTDKAKAEAEELSKSLQAIGYSDAELSGITDHRMFVLARKAMLFDKIQSGDIESKKVKTAPKSASPAAKRSTLTAKQKAMQQAKERARSGKVNDAQAAIKKILFGD